MSITFAVRHTEPLTLEEWERRGWLKGLTFVRDIDHGPEYQCPCCHANTRQGKVYRDGRFYRAFSLCSCGHLWERLGESW